MWYKAKDGKLINLDTVIFIDKISESNSPSILFYLQAADPSNNTRLIIHFPSENERNIEYNKIFTSLKSGKVQVII